MRVLAVTNMYPPHHLGGYELSCRDVMRRFSARGHHVTVLTSTMRVPGIADPSGERDAGVHRDLELYWDDHRLVSPPVAERWRIERRNQRGLSRVVRLARPDVVSIWNMGAMSMGLLNTLARSRIPLVYVICDDWLIKARRLDPWFALFRSRPKVARLVEAVARVPTRLPDLGRTGVFCFISDYTRGRALERTQWAFPVSDIVYNGIDRDDFGPRPGSTQRPWRGRLMYAGRLDPRKGVETLLRAASMLAGSVVEVNGRGDDDELTRLQGLMEALGLSGRVEFRADAREQLADRYRAADLVVFPSEWAEPFGLVPIEAMACGTPVVATGTGGSSEYLVDGENCLLYPPGDHEALAACVTRLATDADLRRRLAEAGGVTADRFTVDHLTDALEHWHAAAAAFEAAPVVGRQ